MVGLDFLDYLVAAGDRGLQESGESIIQERCFQRGDELSSPVTKCGSVRNLPRHGHDPQLLLEARERDLDLQELLRVKPQASRARACTDAARTLHHRIPQPRPSTKDCQILRQELVTIDLEHRELL
jgi:hypothetical protein